MITRKTYSKLLNLFKKAGVEDPIATADEVCDIIEKEEPEKTAHELNYPPGVRETPQTLPTQPAPQKAIQQPPQSQAMPQRGFFDKKGKFVPVSRPITSAGGAPGTIGK